MSQINDRVISNFCHGVATLPAAALAVEFPNGGSLETFDHFEGIEDAMIKAAKVASREAIGKWFKDIDKRLVVHVGPGEKGVYLTMQWGIEYKGFLTDRYQDVDHFLEAFDAIRDRLKEIVAARYPEITHSWLSHRGVYRRNIGLVWTVVINPRLPQKRAA